MDEEFKAIELHFKDGYVESYDPLVTYGITLGTVYIDSGYHQYVEMLSDLKEIKTCTRKAIYHSDIDIATYEDFDYETVWVIEG